VWKTPAYGCRAEPEQPNRGVGKGKLNSPCMAAAERGPIGSRQAIAERKTRLPQPKFCRQRPHTKPGHDELPRRIRRVLVESTQRFPEHERITRAVRYTADLGGGP